MGNLLKSVQRKVAELCNERITHTGVDFLTLYKETRETEPVFFVYEPSICIVIQGKKEITIDDQRLIYDESTFLVSSMDMPVSGMITEASEECPYLSLGLTFKACEVFEIIAELGDRYQPDKSCCKAIGLSKFTPGLLEAINRLLDCLNNKSDARFLAPMIKKEILYRVLLSEQGCALYNVANNKSDLSGINKAIIFLKENFTANIDTTELPKLASMSQSKFYKRFHEITNLTPLQYRLQLRIQEARRLMLYENMSASEAGFKVGYESPSQFNREYKRVVGMPPHADIKRVAEMGVSSFRENNASMLI
ncbi:AraC family transcriptional regulator [Salmonella enterica subsp. enterica serovar Choleraesuis]|nr:AraC family transcriptional regulator [Salmonella enterica subsp. enterica serovar Choleraesuis]